MTDLSASNIRYVALITTVRAPAIDRRFVGEWLYGGRGQCDFVKGTYTLVQSADEATVRSACVRLVTRTGMAPAYQLSDSAHNARDYCVSVFTLGRVCDDVGGGGVACFVPGISVCDTTVCGAVEAINAFAFRFGNTALHRYYVDTSAYDFIESVEAV